MVKKAPYQKKLTLIFMGRSGCGKGTQASFAIKKLRKEGVSHLETGKFLRQLVESHKNPTTALAKSIMKKGGWVPSWFPAFTVLKEMLERGAIKNHWIIDGSPRRMWEAHLFDEIMRVHGRPEPLAVLIDLDDKEATKRLLLRAKTQKRADDIRASIKNRMESYEKYTVPILHYYKNKGRLISVDGTRPKEQVWESIDAALKKRLGRAWPKNRK